MRAAVVSVGNGLEHDVVHSQCRRISYKRKGDDAPPVFGIRLADIRRGMRAELAAPAAVTDIMGAANTQRRARRTVVIGAIGGVIDGVISIMGERAELALSA